MPDKAVTGIDEELITAKLTRIRQYLGYLEELQKATLEEFRGDFRLRGSAERYLQLAIEGVIDIGNEIISSLSSLRDQNATGTSPIYSPRQASYRRASPIPSL